MAYVFAISFVAAVGGAITGPFLGAWVCDRFGPKNTFIIASVLFSVSLRQMFVWHP